MNIGKRVRTIESHEDDEPLVIPITLPRRERVTEGGDPDEMPIPVPNWPVKVSEPIQSPEEPAP
jgi:hypothetical protein